MTTHPKDIPRTPGQEEDGKAPEQEKKCKDIQGRTQGGGGVQGVQVNPPFFKLIIFIAWLGMHV